MLIGILQTGHTPDDLVKTSGDYPTMFARLLDGHGFTFRTWKVVDMEFPASINDADGWLLTGSRHGAYEDLPFIKPLENFVRDAYAKRVPLVGICFGHQIIAQALGGKVVKSDKGWAVGPQDYDFGGEKLTLNAWHQDQVVEVPKDAQVVGCNDFCENAALVYGDRAYTVQAHPEFQDDFVDGLIKTRGKGLVPDPLMAAATSRLGTPLNDNVIADKIAEFFKHPRA